MTQNIEDVLPPIQSEGLNTDKAVDFDNTLNVQGATTLQSTLAVTGAITATGGVTGAVTGNVTGNVTGDVTGDVAGTVTGAIPLEVFTSADVLTAAESGKTCVLNSATGFQLTLPTAAAGLYFRFIVGGTPPSSGNHTVITPSTADLIHGLIIYAPTDDAGAVDDDADTVTAVASQAQEGDWFDLTCDGTNWFVRGQAQVAEGITLVKAD